MQKIIPVGVKVVGIVVLVLSALFPLLVVHMSASWQGQAPPGAPTGFEDDVMSFSIFSFQAKNVTYDNATNKFVTEDIATDGSDPVAQAGRTITLINMILMVGGIILAALGAMLTLLKGKTKLGAFFSIVGGVFMVLLTGWSFIVQALLIKALEALGGTVSGNVVTFTLSTSIGSTTYQWITKATISLGLGAYLPALGALLTFISLFLKSDEW